MFGKGHISTENGEGDGFFCQSNFMRHQDATPSSGLVARPSDFIGRPENTEDPRKGKTLESSCCNTGLGLAD